MVLSCVSSRGFGKLAIEDEMDMYYDWIAKTEDKPIGPIIQSGYLIKVIFHEHDIIGRR